MSTWHQAPEALDYHWFVSIEAMAASRFPQGSCVSCVEDEFDLREQYLPWAHLQNIPVLHPGKPDRAADSGTAC
jgi:hypothetical protein